MGSVEKVGVEPDPSESALRPRIWNTVDILCRLDPVCCGERRVREQPRLVGSPVVRVEPHSVALGGRLREVVERHARRRHDGVAALAGRDAPEL